MPCQTKLSQAAWEMVSWGAPITVSSNVVEETQPELAVSVWMRVSVPGMLVSAAVRVNP